MGEGPSVCRFEGDLTNGGCKEPGREPSLLVLQHSADL